MVDKNEVIFSRYVRKIQQENEFVHYRMTWFITMQGFLFASMVLLVNASIVDKFLIIIGLAIIGMVSAIITTVSVREAFEAMEGTRSQWEGDFKDLAGSSDFPALMGANTGTNIWKRGRLMAFALPLTVFFVWLLSGTIAAVDLIIKDV